MFVGMADVLLIGDRSLDDAYVRESICTVRARKYDVPEALSTSGLKKGYRYRLSVRVSFFVFGSLTLDVRVARSLIDLSSCFAAEEKSRSRTDAMLVGTCVIYPHVICQVLLECLD
eukprot:COSAG01_NODE_27675_length_679_cov_2.489655_1_plen_116_part_00